MSGVCASMRFSFAIVDCCFVPIVLMMPIVFMVCAMVIVSVRLPHFLVMILVMSPVYSPVSVCSFASRMSVASCAGV